MNTTEAACAGVEVMLSQVDADEAQDFGDACPLNNNRAKRTTTSGRATKESVCTTEPLNLRHQS